MILSGLPRTNQTSADRLREGGGVRWNHKLRTFNAGLNKVAPGLWTLKAVFHPASKFRSQEATRTRDQGCRLRRRGRIRLGRRRLSRKIPEASKYHVELQNLVHRHLSEFFLFVDF